MSSEALTTDPRQGDPPAFREGLYTCNPFALSGSKCEHCGHVGFPVRVFCPKCRREGVLSVSLPTRGSVHTFTIIRQAPKGVAVPYILARITLGDVRVMGQVRASDVGAVAVGSPVELVPALFPTASGSDSGGYAFQLLTEEGSE